MSKSKIMVLPLADRFLKAIFYFPFLAFLFALFLPWASCGQAKPIGFWQGNLVYENRAWDIGLLVESNTKAKIHSNASWRAAAAAENFSVINGSITFDIPIQVGSFKGTLLNNQEIEGAVTITGKDLSVPLTLSKGNLPKVRMQEVTLKNEEVHIAATLVLPETKGKHPTAVIIHGGGNSSRESLPYYFWADYLARNGIASLIYDKRGNGESTGDWKKVGFEERADDVIEALKWLANHDEVDNTQLGLLSISQGTWVAGIVAQSYPDLAYLVNIVGPLVSPLEADTYALKYRLRNAGWPLKDINQRTHLWHLVTNYIRAPQVQSQWDSVQLAIAESSSARWFSKSPYQPNRNSWFYSWYGQIMDHDPIPILKEIDTPILWIYGNRDSQSDFAHNVALIDQLRISGKPYELMAVPDAGHGVDAPYDELGNPDYPTATPPQFFKRIVDYILRN